MKTFLVCAMIVAGAAGFGWIRHLQMVELRRQHAELRASAEEVLRYKTESAEMDQMAVDTNELKRLRAERSELMNLRSEIGRLRQAAKVELPQIQQQVESTIVQTTEVQQREASLLAERAAKQISRLTREFLSGLTEDLRIVAEANGGRFPTSFAEMEMLWRTLPKESRPRYVRDEAGTFLNILVQTNHLSSRETELTGVSFSVSSRSFEFMRHDRTLTTKAPPLPFLREITPRRLPDDSFARYYGFTDGREEESISRDGNFSDWEREQTQEASKQTKAAGN